MYVGVVISTTPCSLLYCTYRCVFTACIYIAIHYTWKWLNLLVDLKYQMIVVDSPDIVSSLGCDSTVSACCSAVCWNCQSLIFIFIKWGDVKKININISILNEGIIDYFKTILGFCPEWPMFLAVSLVSPCDLFRLTNSICCRRTLIETRSGAWYTIGVKYTVRKWRKITQGKAVVMTLFGK